MTGVSTVFEHENVPKHMPEHVSLCIYRLAQESLHNVFKHAKAKDAKVSLRGMADGLEIKVVDSGSGFEPFLDALQKRLGIDYHRRAGAERRWALLGSFQAGVGDRGEGGPS